MAILVRILACTFPTMTLCACAFHDLPKDAFERDVALVSRPANDLNRLVSDLAMGLPGAEERLTARMSATPVLRRDKQALGWATLCGEHFRRLRYADGIVSCGSAETLEPDSAASVLQLIGGLGGRPSPSWDRPGVRIPLHGETVTRVAAGSETADAIVDTGAELAIVSEMAAKRLGGKPVAAKVQVGTTATPVSGMVMFDALGVGTGELPNLPALVLTDAELAPTGVDLILSLPVLLSAARAAFLEHGSVAAMADDAPQLGPAAMRFYRDESVVGFAAGFSGGERRRPARRNLDCPELPFRGRVGTAKFRWWSIPA